MIVEMRGRMEKESRKVGLSWGRQTSESQGPFPSFLEKRIEGKKNEPEEIEDRDEVWAASAYALCVMCYILSQRSRGVWWTMITLLLVWSAPRAFCPKIRKYQTKFWLKTT